MKAMKNMICATSFVNSLVMGASLMPLAVVN